MRGLDVVASRVVGFHPRHPRVCGRSSAMRYVTVDFDICVVIRPFSKTRDWTAFQRLHPAWRYLAYGARLAARNNLTPKRRWVRHSPVIGCGPASLDDSVEGVRYSAEDGH